MPKKLPENLNFTIEAEISRYADGVGIDQLHAVLVDIVSRRTLQRRLSELAQQKLPGIYAEEADSIIANRPYLTKSGLVT